MNIYTENLESMIPGLPQYIIIMNIWIGLTQMCNSYTSVLFKYSHFMHMLTVDTM